VSAFLFGFQVIENSTNSASFKIGDGFLNFPEQQEPEILSTYLKFCDFAGILNLTQFAKIILHIKVLICNHKYLANLPTTPSWGAAAD
jgi:hypothetical protein